MAESAVSFLLNQLSKLLQDEQALLGGIEQEAEYIRGEFGHMKAFLRVADAKEDSDPQLKEWVMQVREIAYDTEDVLDKYIFRFAYPHHGIRKIWYSLKNLKARHQIASQIQVIKSRVENASKSQQRYKDMYGAMDQGSSSTQTSYDHWYDNQGDALLLEEAEVVGIQKPKKRLLDWLLLSNDGLKVISVVGMGGLGKTTLVKKVYDDASVKAKFDCHAWVTVSASFKTEHLLRNLVKELVVQGQQNSPQELEAMNIEAMNVEEMKEFVYKFLQQKTYIVVLDDVWKREAWESIRYVFPRSSTHGCIIITTRSSVVANAACSEINGSVYNLELLNVEESKELFYKKAFPGNLCPVYLKDISQSILKRCNGLPLAIVVIGRLLATKNNNHEEWLMFERNIGIELEGDNLNRMTKLLSLSYYDLPYYLKPCFLYLSIFPEDALLHKWIIIRLWIAEGFVQGRQGKTAEEVAEGYLFELLNRSLIQVAETYMDGRPRKFHIHDILRSWIISKSREQNIVSATLSEEEIRQLNNFRRMVIHTTLYHTRQSYNFKYLRSLLWPEYVDSEFGCPFLYKILRGGCKLLKVLDIRGAALDNIPDEVFKLYHLKYLCLRDTNIKTIPKSIKNLLNLETLDLKESKVTELPIEILKLQKLRHLLVYNYGKYEDFDWVKSFRAPYQIGEFLLSLQKLCFIDADEVEGTKIVKEIGKLTQLRRLGISKLRRTDGKDLCSSLAKLINLRTLYIFSIEEREMMDLDHSLSPSTLPFLSKVLFSGCLEKVPQWVHSLRGLTQLYLTFSRLREDPLQQLGLLPNLVSLSMVSFAYEGEGLSFNGSGFQKLKDLLLGRLRGLRWVRIEKGCMPLLETLDVRDCILMKQLPAGIEHLTNLQYVWFINMSEEFQDGIVDQKSNEREKWKLAHVPIVRAVNVIRGVINIRNWESSIYIMAEGVVSFLLDQLSTLLREKEHLLGELRQEAVYILDELGCMKEFLRVADAKEESDPQLKQWVTQVREVTYDIEDVLESYFLRFANSHHGIKKIWVSLKNLKARHRIASEIQTIKSRVENVSKSQQRYRGMYGLMDQGSSSTRASHDQWYDGRGDALLLEEAEVVGIEKPKKLLLDWVLLSKDGLKVISVVGMTGMGKTTIVKKVYDDILVNANFDCRVWVNVSASFKIERLLRNIIKELVQGQQNPPQELEAMRIVDMKNYVHKFLEKKTYIVVLDDVWKIDAWESIRLAFPRNGTNGCIIITTRSGDIGQAACSQTTNGNTYYLNPLSPEKSEELFYKKAFPGSFCPAYLKEISQSILKKCHGLPLAIVVFGGLLATKNNVREKWLMFDHNIGVELQGDYLSNMTKLLTLSYYDLPHYLKPCFLYLSIFPEDALLNKWIIIRLWIAEGFVQGRQGRTAEEVAEGYLNDLLNRSLIKVESSHSDGRPKKFRIHDILRECIIPKSREQNIVCATSEEDEISVSKKIRRLGVDTILRNHTKESFNVKYLRSLMWLVPFVNSEFGLMLYKILCGGCELLKVLDIRDGPALDRIPDEAFKLHHLKYLCLRNTNIKIIPKSIKNLPNLETLDLKSSKVTELPIEILKLQKLRHLLVYKYEQLHLFDYIKSFKAPYEIGNSLLSLQKLCHIGADEVKGINIVKEIGKLTQLRRLGITKLRREDGKDLCSSLSNLNNLRSLSIVSISETDIMDLDHSLPQPTLPFLHTLAISGCLEIVPQWLHSLHGLTKLQLHWSRLRVDPLQGLGVLPNLVNLHIYNHAYEGEGLSFKNRRFQRLKKLSFYNLRGLRWMRVEEGSMPLLEILKVAECKLMEELPSGMEHLINLQSVMFGHMSKEFMDRITDEKVKEREKWKLVHVPVAWVSSDHSKIVFTKSAAS